ncbi:MAG: adenosylmethionine decarboxylase [Lentisphaeria bacterium]|nr:adenosylmethionine decarboxylase [Lentisphaeria bacterium]
MDKNDSRDGAIALGRQMTVEFYDCSTAVLADVDLMEKIFLEAARVSGAHVVNSNFHSFEPQGVSGVLVISESHFAVHAWPEHDYAAVDLFTCGAGVDFDLAVKSLGAGMKSGRWIVSSMVNRGILRDSGELERLVPVVENQNSCGLQLSWQERFNHSNAGAMSAGIDIYHCRNFDLESEDGFKELISGLLRLLDSKTELDRWSWQKRDNGVEFSVSFNQGRISGFANVEKTLYLDIFANRFFEPRLIAEAVMTALNGTYYRMQPQIRQ